VHGYYVLPFLRDERLAALVDLKADRRAGVLRVHAAHPTEPAGQPDAAPGAVAEDLAAELWRLAGWLGLDDVAVGDKEGTPRGTLAPALAGALVAG
jgi:uncharacterized protein YcaQ